MDHRNTSCQDVSEENMLSQPLFNSTSPPDSIRVKTDPLTPFPQLELMLRARRAKLIHSQVLVLQTGNVPLLAVAVNLEQAQNLTRHEATRLRMQQATLNYITHDLVI